MKLSRRFKSMNFTDLEIAPSASYLLASKKMPESEIDEILNKACQGECITYSIAKRIMIFHTNNKNEQPNTDRILKQFDVQDLAWFNLGSDRITLYVRDNDEQKKFLFWVKSSQDPKGSKFFDYDFLTMIS